MKTTRFFRDNNIIILLAVTGIIVVNIITLLQSRNYLILDNSIKTEVTFIDGITKKYSSNTYDINDAIKLADEKMYENKRIYKERIRSSRELNEKSI